MSDEIDFLLSVCGPEIDGEDEVRGIDITSKGNSQPSPAMAVKYAGHEIKAAE